MKKRKSTKFQWAKVPFIIYKYIKNKTKDNNEIPCLMDEDGKIYISDLDKCNLLARNFEKVFSTNSFQIIDTTSDSNKINDIEINIGSIWDVLRQLPAKNSSSPDAIPYALLKNCSESLAPILADIFRLILDSGQIPTIWRIAIITPIFKKGEKTDPKNYRPISITCTICRVFERILHGKIMEFKQKIIL